MTYRRVAQLKSAEQFRAHQQELNVELPLDEELLPHGPLSTPITVDERLVGNRFAILPMEGWDGTEDGRPTELTQRRWENFGRSGAKLIWGGEAVAVRHDGRANPNQLWLYEKSAKAIEDLRARLVRAHEDSFGSSADLLVGLQLTHSGRFCRPNSKSRIEPRVAYRHDLLDAKVGGIDENAILSDDEIRWLIDDFVLSARQAATLGFDFVDIKHCHGYLGHEFLSAVDRDGAFGGSFENRTRFLVEIVDGIRTEAPTIKIGVRVSAFDWKPFEKGDDGIGRPTSSADPYRWAFGGNGTGVGIDLAETHQLFSLMQSLGIRLVCVTAGSPYYCPHIQRPALFPPSDGYGPPEDPLVGVARQITATGQLKKAHPDMLVVGSGYSYLQEWLPNVAQAVVRDGLADAVGLGRMVLSYPELPADVLAGRPLERKRICRTFSDCTTGPRLGLVSGCYPLDPFYKGLPQHAELSRLKADT
jgi:2,4-dienoyl-CoA reductase-like NADH-dependent reductase (Old Yellow Enzyme family)